MISALQQKEAKREENSYETIKNLCFGKREERGMWFDLIKAVYEMLLSLLKTCKFTDIYD